MVGGQYPITTTRFSHVSAVVEDSSDDDDDDEDVEVVVVTDVVVDDDVNDDDDAVVPDEDVLIGSSPFVTLSVADGTGSSLAPPQPPRTTTATSRFIMEPATSVQPTRASNHCAC